MLLAGNQTKLRASEIARPPHGEGASRGVLYLCERRRRRRISKRDARAAAKHRSL